MVACHPAGIEFDQLVECVYMCEMDPVTETTVKNAFGFFDHGKGSLSVADLKKLLTTRGDVMSEAEVLCPPPCPTVCHSRPDRYMFEQGPTHVLPWYRRWTIG